MIVSDLPLLCAGFVLGLRTKHFEMSEPSNRRARIEAELRERLDAIHVEVIDESQLHAGHAGARDGGGHFRAVVVSAQFDGKNPIERQRLVYRALEGVMGAEIHALSMKTLTPAQWMAAGRTS